MSSDFFFISKTIYLINIPKKVCISAFLSYYIYNKNNVQSAYFKVYLKQLQFLKPSLFQENASNKLNLTHPFNVLLTFAAIGYILAIYIFPYFCAKEMRVIINAKQVIVYFNYSRVCLKTYIHKMHFSPTQ